MFFVIVLLAGIAWLLWTIREEIQQLSYRQRDQSATLERLIQRLESAAAPAQSAPSAREPAATPVNLNTASKSALQGLPKIGAVSADNIIAARPFTEVAQLAGVAGISEAVFEDLKDKVTV